MKVVATAIFDGYRLQGLSDPGGNPGIADDPESGGKRRVRYFG